MNTENKEKLKGNVKIKKNSYIAAYVVSMTVPF
jgi:hypothetical protein